MPTSQKLEHLSVPFQIKRAAADQGNMTFSGYGSVFNVLDANGDAIAPGAFADSIALAKKSGRWPAMLMQHGGWGLGAEDMNPIGIWLDLEEDEKGLLAEGKLADTTRGIDIYKLMKMEPRAAIDSLSIGYIATDYTTNDNPKEGEPRRTINKVELWEISPVTFPANKAALVQQVKNSELVKNPRELEKALRDGLGLSNREAKALLANGFKGLCTVRDERGELDDLTVAAAEQLLATLATS